MDEKIKNILREMEKYLSTTEMQMLQKSLIINLLGREKEEQITTDEDYLKMFLNTKKIEGCSDRTLRYYEMTINHLLNNINISLRQISTNDMRRYLNEYQKINNCGKITIDNIRRNISSFFTWLETEDYILKSPMRRIHKIKTTKVVKSIINDEVIEKIRDNCKCKRDLAMIDLLYSTSMRVGELVKLNISDINFQERECIVYGKGDKQRKVYFDAKAKIHIENYLNDRKDNNEALFVTLDKPYDRLKISGVEIRIRQLGRKLNIERIYPHKFRRSMATRAIDKGMPIEQV